MENINIVTKNSLMVDGGLDNSNTTQYDILKSFENGSSMIMVYSDTDIEGYVTTDINNNEEIINQFKNNNGNELPLICIPTYEEIVEFTDNTVKQHMCESEIKATLSMFHSRYRALKYFWDIFMNSDFTNEYAEEFETPEIFSSKQLNEILFNLLKAMPTYSTVIEYIQKTADFRAISKYTGSF